MKVYVSYEAYRKMILASRYASPYEIAGLLYGKIDGTVVVEDADVFKIQSVTSASVNVEPEEFAEHAAKLSKEQVEKVIGFWHSHGNMRAFHSSVDVETSNILVKQINPLITITTNAGGEMKAIIYVYVEKLGEAFDVDAEVELMLEDDGGLRKLVEKLKKKLEKMRKKKTRKTRGEAYVASPWPYQYGLDELLDGEAEELEQDWRRYWQKYLEEW